jgi:DNA repair protein RadA/Sms
MRRDARGCSPPEAQECRRPGVSPARLSVPAGSVQGMAKSSAGPAFQCAECGWRTTKWSGRCGECQAWGTVGQAAARPARAAGFGAAALAGLGGLGELGLGGAGLGGAGLGDAGLGGAGRGGAGRGGAGLGGPPAALAPASPALPIGEVDATAAGARPTGLDELDRVLGGGLVPGAVVLLAGEPGVGKSTLLLEAGTHAAAAGPVLYITGEESAAQVRLRADRIGAVAGNLYLAAETDLAALLGHVAVVRPRLLIVDSVQTITMEGVDGTPGGVSQIRAVTAALIAVAKQHAVTTVLVGHVTKDGSIAGPRALEHLVDVVLHFEGDRHAQFRMVRAVKNRYGPTDEIGCFDLGEQGITELPDPSGLFLTHRRNAVPGTCVTVTLEGRRPLLSEVQTLVAPSALDIPRRVTSGLDASRVGMVLAVLSRRADLKLGKQDVYAATVGGVRLGEPSVDLAVALALASAVVDLSVPGSVVAVGEVGLAGEVRRVTGVQRRLAEAERMGFRLAIVPAGWAGQDSAAKGSAAKDPATRGSASRNPAARGSASRNPAARGSAARDPAGGIEVREVEDIREAMAAAFGG